MNENHALLPGSIKAAILDGILLIVSIYVVSECLNSFKEVRYYARIFLAALLFVLYNPFFSSSYGGTIGHSLNHIQVKKGCESRQ